MERVLNQDERIRRAEELYERRKMQVNGRTATVSVEKGSKNKFTRKLIIQLVVCLLIYGAYYAIENVPNFVSQDLMYKISDILEYDINFGELYSKYIENPEAKEENIETNILIEDTLSATEVVSENVDIGGAEETQPIVVEPEIFEDSSSISQMEVDAEYIKENYSLIKPLEGEITSRYGIRNPKVATVPKYHTGIDIARVTGTVIIAAMEGTVELVSSQGDYGNHVKITNGEVSTLYAHCSKIYVSEGEQISQGQQIAEVGATGNVTGPHLHFEIRRNNQYVDPDLLLEF